MEETYSYYEAPGATADPERNSPTTKDSALDTTRPLPALPGQSRARETTDMVVDELRALQLGESRVAHIESFLLRQLGTFRGDYNGEAVTEWVEKVDLLKDILSAPDAEILRILPLRMSARAMEFFRSFLSGKESSERTWQNLKRAMLTQFGGKVEPTQVLNQLQQARLGRNTPVREFGLQVGRLARLAYPELSSDIGTPDQKRLQTTLFNRIALEQFIAGLPPLLSRPILERKITDFQEAVELAAHHEEINARYLKRSTINAIHAGEDTRLSQLYSDDPSMYNENPASHLMAPVTSDNSSGGPSGQRPARERFSGRRSSPYRRREVVCYGCQRVGHYKRDCPRQRGATRRTGCTICGEPGHSMPQCMNIVCAACKGNGHPANHCPKNGLRRGPPRPNISF